VATKKHLIIAVLITSCIAFALLSALPLKSTAEAEYDAFYDLNMDGKINLSDLIKLATHFGAEGTPINTTALLLELQTRINSLNASLLNSEAYLKTRINTLEASVAELQSRIDSLNASLLELQYQIDNMYLVNVKACIHACPISVNITKDGIPLGFTTPATFVLTRNHTFTVPSFDSSNHLFKQWSTGSTNTTITITSGGEYVAYYDVDSMHKLITPGEIGIYDLESGAEVFGIDWNISQGETKSVTYYLRNKSLSGRLHSFRWTTNGTLPSYLHLSMAFVQDG
jgi:hypothetical protein